MTYIFVCWGFRKLKFWILSEVHFMLKTKREEDPLLYCMLTLLPLIS